MIPTPSRRHSAWTLYCCILWATAFAVAASNAPLANAKILITAQTLGVQGAIYEFDDLGNLLGTLDATPGGDILSSISTDGARIVVGRALNGFRDYSMDGTFRGYLPGLPAADLFPVVEFDAHGAIYLLGVGAARRLNPDGTASMTFSNGGNGIDADAAGNVYISAGAGIQKYSSSGLLLGNTVDTRVTGDVAIDEIGQKLYAGGSANNGFGSILAYDISGPAPIFIRSIQVPASVTGISFDPSTGHLLEANLFGGDAREITTDGALVRRYLLPGTNPIDVVAVRIPEPATSWLFNVAIVCGPMRYVLGSKRNRKF